MLQRYHVITSDTCIVIMMLKECSLSLTLIATFLGVANHTSLIYLLTIHEMNVKFDFLNLLSCVLELFIIYLAL